MENTGIGLNGFFTGMWNIEEGQNAPGSGSWNRIETDADWGGAASLDLNIRIPKKDDPGNNTNDENVQPGLATFTASYKNNSKDHVDIQYFVDGSENPISVPANGVTDEINVTGFMMFWQMKKEIYP